MLDLSLSHALAHEGTDKVRLQGYAGSMRPFLNSHAFIMRDPSLTGLNAGKT